MLIPTAYRAQFFLLAGTVTLSVVFVAQYGLGMRPCPLCLWQRVPWSFVIFLALCDYMFLRRVFMLWLGYGVSLLASAGLAFYHIGVERQFWQSFLASCESGLSLESVEDLMQSLEGPIESAACDERVIFLFDLSFADWNFLLSLILGLFALLPLLTGARWQNN